MVGVILIALDINPEFPVIKYPEKYFPGYIRNGISI